MAVSTPHIQIILEEQSVPKNLETALRRVGAATSFWSFSDALRVGLTASADAVVVVAPSDAPRNADRLQSLFDRMADRPRATLVLREDTRPHTRTNHPPALPVAYGAGLGADELTVRLSTMIEMRDSLESLHRARGIVDHAPEPPVEQAYLQQLRLASQIQRELLPDVLPHYGPVTFSSVYRPAEYVSGDIYDIQQLDQEHVAIGVADVTGHGMPAALLTVFLKRALRGRAGAKETSSPAQPDEVLRRLNDEILELNFSECSFAAMVYAVLNTRSLRLRLARAGAPYPILRRADGRLALVRSAGSLIGVQPDAEFVVEEIQLGGGDGLLLYTDGLERVVLPRECPGPAREKAAGVVGGATPLAAVAGRPASVGAVCAVPGRTNGNGHGRGNGDARRTRRASPQALRTDGDDPAIPPDQAIAGSAWFALLGEQGERAALEHLSLRHDLLRRIGHPLDDLTVLALRIDP